MTDVTDSEQVAAAVRIATERFGGLDVAFANAGVFGDARRSSTTPRTSSTT